MHEKFRIDVSQTVYTYCDLVEYVLDLCMENSLQNCGIRTTLQPTLYEKAYQLHMLEPCRIEV